MTPGVLALYGQKLFAAMTRRGGRFGGMPLDCRFIAQSGEPVDLGVAAMDIQWAAYDNRRSRAAGPSCDRKEKGVSIS
ncbi:hypothetical protein [Burkholderia stagnalis]